jgi:flagellar hook-associated protein 2
MATFNFSGAISGLDTAGMISALMAAERLPLTRLENQRKALKTQQTSYGDLRGLLAKLETAAKAFTKDMAGAKRAAASSAATVLSATAGTTAEAATYSVVVDHLATSTRATSTGAMGRAITGADLGSTLASLNLPGAVTAGEVGMVVDGRIVRATIGDPSTATLGDALTAIGDALTAQVQANEGGGSTATVTASIVDNKVQVTLAGTAQTHNLSFGVGGDTSNALGMLGLTGTGPVALSTAAPMSGRSALGVTRTSVALDLAGLTGLASGAGTLTINGAAIAYDSTTDSLSTIIGRINGSTAGVVASMDRTNDRLVITARSGGASPMAIEDTGTLATALRLAPGTTDAQVLGTQAQVTVDGRTYLSDTNKVATAISGVTLTLLSEGTSTVTVTPDEDGMAEALKTLVDAYNTLADKLDTLTANERDTTRGALAANPDVRSMAMSFRRTLLGTAATGGAFTSLSQLGVSTGVVGAAAGSTNRLQLDTEKLKAALAQDSTAVGNLLNSVTGAIKPLQDAVSSWTRTGGRIDDALESITTQLKAMDRREDQMQARIDSRQAALEKKFATLEATLAKLQSQSSSVAAQVSSSNNNSDD